MVVDSCDDEDLAAVRVGHTDHEPVVHGHALHQTRPHAAGAFPRPRPVPPAAGARDGVLGAIQPTAGGGHQPAGTHGKVLAAGGCPSSVSAARFPGVRPPSGCRMWPTSMSVTDPRRRFRRGLPGRRRPGGCRRSSRGQREQCSRCDIGCALAGSGRRPVRRPTSSALWRAVRRLAGRRRRPRL